MKRRIAQLVSTIMIVSLFFSHTSMITAQAASKWEGYLKISTVDDLARLSNSNVKFYLTQDIDLGDYGLWTPINGFRGTLDGNGYCIKNMSSTAGGLFERLGSATIKNLGLTNVNVKSAVGIAGVLANNARDATIENCYITGKMESGTRYVSAHMGVFFGYANENTTLKNCVNFAPLKGMFGDTGGFIGFAEKGVSLENCINYATVENIPDSAYKFPSVGGIAGKLNSSIKGCFQLADVDSNYGSCGSIAGYTGKDGFFANCGYLTDTAPTDVGKADASSLAQANRYTKEQLRKKSTYKGYDFKNTWVINNKINNGYPILAIMLKDYKASAVTASKESGTYEKNTTISFSTKIDNAKIYYTTNGKNPSKTSKKYTEPIKLTANTKIRVAIYVGDYRGVVKEYKYTIIR